VTTWRSALLAAVTVALFAEPAEAKDYEVHQRWSFARRAEELIGILVAYDQHCDHGCRYHAPGVERAVILEHRRTPDSFYVWISVKDIQDAQWFTHVTVKRRERGAHVEFNIVTPEVAASLERVSGKRSAPRTDRCGIVADFEEKWDGERFVETRVNYSTNYRLGGLFALVGSGIIHSRLEEVARTTYLDLRSGPPVEK
jgi:hypothetical protein